MPLSPLLRFGAGEAALVVSTKPACEAHGVSERPVHHHVEIFCRTPRRKFFPQHLLGFASSLDLPLPLLVPRLDALRPLREKRLNLGRGLRSLGMHQIRLELRQVLEFR